MSEKVVCPHCGTYHPVPSSKPEVLAVSPQYILIAHKSAEVTILPPPEVLEALRFYADNSNWRSASQGSPPVALDGGGKAVKALKALGLQERVIYNAEWNSLNKP